VTTILVGLLAWTLIGLAVGLPLGRIIHTFNPIDEV
jgi:hypothetical protein